MHDTCSNWCRSLLPCWLPAAEIFSSAGLRLAWFLFCGGHAKGVMRLGTTTVGAEAATSPELRRRRMTGFGVRRAHHDSARRSIDPLLIQRVTYGVPCLRNRVP